MSVKSLLEHTTEASGASPEESADYNAARNIGVRHLRRNRAGGDGGAPLGVRLNSGTLNVNGGYSRAEESVGTGVHAESHD